ncbi:hypothetical protein PENTCL1PPCAC_14208, partial [Pristionchus entomophagus]
RSASASFAAALQTWPTWDWTFAEPAPFSIENISGVPLISEIRSPAHHEQIDLADLNCKRCRFDHIDRLLKHTGGASSDQSASTSAEQSPEMAASPALIQMQQSSGGASDTPLLTRMHAEYKAMAFTQLSSELHARSDVPHPMQISVENGPFFPVDFAALTIGNRIQFTASLRFGSEAFPEFAALSETDKWKIVKRFMFPCRMLECGYRTIKYFANEPNKIFASYATYFTAHSATNFFSTAPQDGDTASAEEYLHRPEFIGMLPEIQGALERFDPSYEEFLALFLLTFWNIGQLKPWRSALRARTHYREAVMKELHVVYRNTMQINDYAARLGELMLLLHVFEKTTALQEHFEVFRLCNVVPDDNFVYGLQRE